jgi:hypothetical protein
MSKTDPEPEVEEEEEEKLPAPVKPKPQVGEEEIEALPEESIFVPAEILEKAPPEVRRSIEAFFAMMSHGPIPNPVTAKLVEKFTPEHISFLLQSQDRDTEHEYGALASGRRYQLVCLILGAALFVFLVLYLSGSNPDLLERLITLLMGLVGGFGGGFAFGSRNKKT